MIIILFLALILLPMIDNITKFSTNFDIDLDENRSLAKFPSIRNEKGVVRSSLVKKFPKNFENYYNDNFGMRKILVSIAKKLRLHQSSMNRKYVEGLEDWLFLTQENSLKNAIGSNLLNTRELQNTYNILMRNWELCKKNNIDYLFVITPSKYSIYPEYMPRFISSIFKRKRVVKTNTDQVLEFLKKKSPDFPVLDLRLALIEAKKKNGNEFVYFRRDSHWNGIGIESGYKELKGLLASKFKIRLSAPSYNIFKDFASHGDLSKMSGKKHQHLTSLIRVKDNSKQVSNKNIGKYSIESFINMKSKNLKSAFIQHDSFFDHQMKKLLKNSFRKSSFAHRYSSCEISKRGIKGNSIVIHEMVERTLADCRKNRKVTKN